MNPKEIQAGCARCEGQGYYYVPNGDDDVDAEPCECVWDKLEVL